jgi:hypothetical protein
MNRLWVLLTILLISCEGDQTLRYRITGLEAIPLETSAAYPVELTGTTCSAGTFGIRLDLKTIETYRKGRYFDYYESYADCENNFKYLRIRSTTDFNATHPAGTLLNDCFYYFPGDYTQVTGVLVDSTPPEITARYMPDYETQNFPLYADLLMLEKPSEEISLSFDVEIEWSNGFIFQSSTPVITLIP